MADSNALTSSDFELPDEAPETAPRPAWGNGESRSPYRLPASEQLRGVANRIIFSRYYILFYFVMMTLSLATVVLSLIATSEPFLSLYGIPNAQANTNAPLLRGMSWR